MVGTRNGKGGSKKEDGASDVSYSRDFFLQLKAASTKSAEPRPAEALHCMPRSKLGEIAEPARPRAASDSAHPAVKNKPTTVKISGIPGEYSRTGVCEELAAAGFGYAIDFLYMPIDAATGYNLNHAFVNVRSKDAYRDFLQAFHGVPTKSCLSAYPSEEVCEVSISEIQGRDANMQALCTSANLKKWATNDDWQPLFLDDYGKKVPLNEMEKQRSKMRGRAASDRMAAWSSPKLTPQVPPSLKPEQGASKKLSSPPMRAEAKVFSPGLRAEAKSFSPTSVPDTVVMPPAVISDASASSPSLRAEANEFVPTGLTMLPETAFVD